jgi:hypothetical protein
VDLQQVGLVVLGAVDRVDRADTALVLGHRGLLAGVDGGVHLGGLTQQRADVGFRDNERVQRHIPSGGS